MCHRLTEQGHEVSALVRRPGSEPPGTRQVLGHLGEDGGLPAALASVAPECVFHLAAEIASQRSEAKVREVNVAGTRRLLDACLGLATGPRVVFSSTVVTGEANGELLTEERPLPVHTPYGRAKQEGEQMVLDSRLPTIVIRPSHVYGPGGWYAQELIPRLRQPGRFAVIGRGDNQWDVVHVDDVVSALTLAIDAPAGSTYHVVDDEPTTFYDFMALTAQTLGTGPPRRIPAWVASLAAGRNAVDAVVRSARSSNEKIKRELGWQPRFATARQGVPNAIARLAAAS
jgi:nucleoside-diphosphate-sugar epimerase